MLQSNNSFGSKPASSAVHLIVPTKDNNVPCFVSTRFLQFIFLSFQQSLRFDPLRIWHLIELILKILSKLKTNNFSFILRSFQRDFQCKIVNCFQIALTWSIFELEKCSFFLNRSEFRQKLIGYVITELRRQKCVQCRQNQWSFKGWCLWS